MEGRFIELRGPGVQQIAIDVDNIDSMISDLVSIGVRMVSEVPVIGSDGHRIAFVHPSSESRQILQKEPDMPLGQHCSSVVVLSV